MSFAWTKEQQQVIDLRDCNILVSAAAGSGKTAVLVERIIGRITDVQFPLDIDRLLIVTFTNAAAGEMRERIRDAIEKRLTANPENEHLEKQLTLVHQAQITTIHSFCQQVIRNYFHLIDLDPSFRIADEGELKLLKKDIVELLIEEAYAGGEKDFLHFVECYATGKNDTGIDDIILQLYEFSMSDPQPLKWLLACENAYNIETIEELEAAPWIDDLLEQVQRLVTDALEKTRLALKITNSPDGPYPYEAALREDEKLLLDLQGEHSYLEYAKKLTAKLKFATLSSKKDEAISDEKREQVKLLRDQVKKSLGSLREQYFYAEPQKIAENIGKSRSQIAVLTNLVAAFLERFREQKRAKNLLDFSDLEHLALEILLKDEDGELVPSEAAKQLSEQFAEVMIDEYQDSNMVQEYILNAVSRVPAGQNNIFMVGDVKQSIYRFRLARPELFMYKYETYTVGSGQEQKIELHQNFRSRAEVLDSTNTIFEKIMKKDLGNVAYDENAALYLGANFPVLDADKTVHQTEILLLDLETEKEIYSEAEETNVELETRLIGKRIRELVGHMPVLDKETGKYRLAGYRDIVILLRTVSGWADTIARVLNDMGIPAFTGSKIGYFSAIEVQTVLSLLRVIDNPKQDIPLAAVLRSPICGLTDEELALIKSSSAESSFAKICHQYKESEKLENFFILLADFRKRVPYTPMHELLWYILEQTGYLAYVSAMPGGEQRMANLNMLVEKAIAYESTSYRGLFNFIRYIEQLKKYDVDYGEASVLGEEEDTVRLLSIHKSKGLEFPIVFVSGMHKQFNMQDSRSKMVFHSDLGVGCDFVDPILRSKTPTLLKKIMQRQGIYESLGEELRVLYVAMTRAKEKLIMTGVVTKREAKCKKWQHQLSFSDRAAAMSYLDWVIPAVNLCEPDLLAVQFAGLGELVHEEAKQQLTAKWRKEELIHWDTERIYDEEVHTSLAEAFAFCYPYQNNEHIYGKITVSELKALQQGVDTENEYEMFEETPIIPLLPNFIREREVTGAALGTIYHRFLEAYDYTRESALEAVHKQLHTLVESGRLLETEESQIDSGKIISFLTSNLGMRMKAAAENGVLFREQQFVMGMPATEVREQWQSEETVLIQGIIDAYFYEAEALVLVDYKTDFVPNRNAGFLLDKYHTQLQYYAKALERLTGKKVKEQWIYSFGLQKALRNK